MEGSLGRKRGANDGERGADEGGGQALVKFSPHLLQFADISSYVDIFHPTWTSSILCGLVRVM